MNFRIRLPGSVYRFAKERAGGTDVQLAQKIVEYVTNYAHGTTAQQKGGRATTDAMTQEQLRARSQKGVAARWGRAAETDEPQP